MNRHFYLMKTLVARILSIFSLAALTAVVVSAGPQFVEGDDPKPEGSKWVPVEELSDEFEGSEIDRTKWQTAPIGNDWRWEGRPPALFTEEAIVVEEGEMRVTVGVLPEMVFTSGSEYTYEGGIVRAINPGHHGWYYEARMKANQTEMSSTFWLMTKYTCDKKIELDIQECVGRTSELSDDWAKEWDEIYHSNVIHRHTDCHPEPTQRQSSVVTDTKNWERFYVYGAWWKSPNEVQFFLDGKYVYSIAPSKEFDVPAFLHMAIETYDWNPLPEDGGLVASGTKEQRTTRYDWVRTWRLEE